MHHRVFSQRWRFPRPRKRWWIVALLVPWLLLWWTRSSPGLACLWGFVALGGTLVALAFLLPRTSVQSIPASVAPEAVPLVTLDPPVPQKKLLALPRTLVGVYQMHPNDFEDLAAAVVMVEHGALEYVRHGGRTHDQGVDAYLKSPSGRTVIVQAKRFTKKAVDAPIIRQFKGTLDEQDAVYGYVVTCLAFSRGAKQAQDHYGSNIRLIDGKKLEAYLRLQYEAIAAIYGMIQQQEKARRTR